MNTITDAEYYPRPPPHHQEPSHPRRPTTLTTKNTNDIQNQWTPSYSYPRRPTEDPFKLSIHAYTGQRPPIQNSLLSNCLPFSRIPFASHPCFETDTCLNYHTTSHTGNHRPNIKNTVRRTDHSTLLAKRRVAPSPWHQLILCTWKWRHRGQNWR